ncbi:MAG: hypothetical protein LBH25_04410 [Fibromonadaceae bacterium]|jgi:uncharacterized protein (TIGR02145 family)|nr:hypothetical protein [Fibromonadaceae bacterium]
MNKIHSKGRVSLPITLMASIALALSFTFNACSGGGGNELGYNPGTSSLCNGVSYDPSVHRCESGELIGKCKGEDYYPAYEQCVNGTVVSGAGSGNSSSSGNSSAWQSSSSMASSNSNMLLSSSSIRSSSSVQYSGTFTDNRDNITYKWVRIGEQVWMAENLNYATTTNSICKDKYGCFYDWATAMVLPYPNCVQISCSSIISSKHRGICPSGWHIPNNEDWDKLMRYVDGNSGTESPYSSLTAGRHLKATSGWNIDGIGSNGGGNGEDTFGFSALQGGVIDPYGSYNNSYCYSYWWSASEYSNYNAYFLCMGCDFDNAYYTTGTGTGKSYYRNVRCLKD